MYTLPILPYKYDALEPHIDARTLEIHYNKHHQSYVDGLNKAEEKLVEARKNNDYGGIKSIMKDIAFHGSGHMLHSLFWANLTPTSDSGKPSGDLLEKIKTDFVSVEAMQAEFAAAAAQVEGSGWGMLGWDIYANKLQIMQIEKHQDLHKYGVVPLLVCDVWEHTYYLQYQNKRPEWIKNFWEVVNWQEVSDRFAKIYNIEK